MTKRKRKKQIEFPSHQVACSQCGAEFYCDEYHFRFYEVAPRHCRCYRCQDIRERGGAICPVCNRPGAEYERPILRCSFGKYYPVKVCKDCNKEYSDFAILLYCLPMNKWKLAELLIYGKDLPLVANFHTSVKLDEIVRSKVVITKQKRENYYHWAPGATAIRNRLEEETNTRMIRQGTHPKWFAATMKRFVKTQDCLECTTIAGSIVKRPMFWEHEEVAIRACKPRECPPFVLVYSTEGHRIVAFSLIAINRYLKLKHNNAGRPIPADYGNQAEFHTRQRLELVRRSDNGK